MSNFDLNFCKVYVYAKGWPGINLGASLKSCAHSSLHGISESTYGAPHINSHPT